MSTRANVVIKDSCDSLWFYRHSDGYPEGTGPALLKFMGWVAEGRIRNSVGQASGWLIMIGAKEYGTKTKYTGTGFVESEKTNLFEPDPDDKFSGWKVGAFEPTTGQHGDVDYTYELDLDALTIKVYDGALGNRLVDTIEFKEGEQALSGQRTLSS